jgi:hypothetical protein
MLTRYRQYPNQDCKSYTDEFENLRVESGMTKDNAFFYLQQGTHPLFRNKLVLRETPPNTYDAWVVSLTKLQQQLDQAKEFNEGRVSYPTRNYPQNQTSRPSQQPALSPGVPMDIDATRHAKGKKAMTKKTSSAKPQSKPPSKPAHRLAPHPNAASSSKTRPTLTQGKRKPFFCYLCQGEGHYARDCTENIRNLDPQHIRQLAMALDDSLELKSQLDELEDEEEEEENGEDEADEENDQDGNLISFEPEEPTSGQEQYDLNDPHGQAYF